MSISWSTQIFETYNEKLDYTNQSPLPINLVNYWIMRKTNLENLYEQIKLPAIQAVTSILEKINSVYSISMKKIIKELVISLHEAQDISLWLPPILRQTTQFNGTNFINSKDLIDPLVHIMNLIWKNSMYSAKVKRIIELIKCISNFLILKASEDLEFPMLFQSDPDEGLLRITKTMEILEYFR